MKEDGRKHRERPATGDETDKFRYIVRERVGPSLPLPINSRADVNHPYSKGGGGSFLDPRQLLPPNCPWSASDTLSRAASVGRSISVGWVERDVTTHLKVSLGIN